MRLRFPFARAPRLASAPPARIEPIVAPPAPAPDLRGPAGGEPPVSADALLDLALLMRDRFWIDAGFGSDADRALACAALARIFPHLATAVERCPCELDAERDPAAAYCEDCATDRAMRGHEAKLSAYLAPLARPAVIPPLTHALRALLPPTVGAGA